LDFKNLRIGYVPYDKTLRQPGDRRRFCYYTSKRNIKFEIAKPSETYDLVYVTHGADITVWCDYQKGHTKIIYEIIDSYLAIPKSDQKGLLRGLAKYVTGQYRYLRLNQWKTIQSMCQRSDAVACTTLEQKQDILPFCPNVHLILDIKSMYKQRKTNYDVGETFNFAWEGMPTAMHSFNEIKEAFTYLKSKYKIALHLVTALEYYQYLGKYGKRRATDYVRSLFGLDDIYLYQWHEDTCSHIISACDMALIPLLSKNTFDWGKPEDKLLIFWLMGLPTAVSATPAHKRTMEKAGLSMACETQQDWINTLERYMQDKPARNEAGEKGFAYASTFNSDERILRQWDLLFESVLL
jgi:hypothetical protein